MFLELSFAHRIILSIGSVVDFFIMKASSTHCPYLCARMERTVVHILMQNIDRETQGLSHLSSRAQICLRKFSLLQSSKKPTHVSVPGM